MECFQYSGMQCFPFGLKFGDLAIEKDNATLGIILVTVTADCHAECLFLKQFQGLVQMSSFVGFSAVNAYARSFCLRAS